MGEIRPPMLAQRRRNRSGGAIHSQNHGEWLAPHAKKSTAEKPTAASAGFLPATGRDINTQPRMLESAAAIGSSHEFLVVSCLA
jgi:hypothetical protein